MLVALVLVLAAWMFVSFTCSLMEACLLSISRADLAVMEGRYPRTAVVWRNFKDRLQRPLSVILILNTIAHTLGAAFSGTLFKQGYGGSWLWAFTLGISFVMIQWTEILPKSLGARFNRRVAVAIAMPLSAAVTLLRPVVWFIHLLNRPFERRSRGDEADPLEDLYAMARFAALSRKINPEQERLIAGATRLSDQSVQDLMIPWEDVSFLTTNMSINEALAQAHVDGHTRFPLCEANEPERVIGYVTFKEIVGVLRTNPRDTTLKGISRPMVRISSNEMASGALRTFAEGRQHIALVEEAGRPVGILTIEDILEEPLGDMAGESIKPPEGVQELGAGRWIVGGGLSLVELRGLIGKKLPGIPEEGTLAEWIGETLGHVPKVNETVERWGLRITIRRVRHRKVFEATVLEL